MNTRFSFSSFWIAFLLLAISATAKPVEAAQSPDGIWEDVSEPAIPTGKRFVVPSAYRTLQLDMASLRANLAQAPMEFTPAAQNYPLEMSLPLPDGRFVQFRVVESPIMEKGLADQVPNTKAFSGRAINDPAMTIRFDISSQGFRAMILTPGRTFLIDPYDVGDQRHYIVYDKREAGSSKSPFHCNTEDLGVSSFAPGAPNIHESGTLRTYQLAMAATWEYTEYFRQRPGDTDLDARIRAFDAMHTTVNRVNAIFERDLSVRLQFVSNNLNLIYATPTTDPYNGFNIGSTEINTVNQGNIDDVIGTENYDIGHVVGVGTGGRAARPSVCVEGDKARASTGRPDPLGDPFDVDYVAHEIGHQFGAQHTFNDGTNGSCGGNNRAAGAAFEPGSGSTIM